MSKILTFICAECGEVYRFHVGAGPHMATWKEAVALIDNKKETDKLLEAYVKASEMRDSRSMETFSTNYAVTLTNVNYAVADPQCEKLFEDSALESSAPVFNDVVKAQIAESHARWSTIIKRDGIVAFNAIYMCPKTRHLKQGYYLRMKWTEDKKERVLEHQNKCEDCGTTLKLVDDCNMGFSFEWQPTTAKCSKCNGTLIAEHTLFNK